VSQRGQVAPVAVAALVLLAMGIALLGHLAAIRSGGARGQAAADVAALAAARVAADDPDAPAADLRVAASAAARANGDRLRSFRLESRGPGFPEAVQVTVAATTRGDVPGLGRRADITVARARAGIAYSAVLPDGSFRPVDTSGATGVEAAIRAAEAQIGWPYIWGGESRAEGGFDCSGLVDFALSAAGVRLPGRPTAADLWRLARPEPPSSLAPGDLVFLGAGSGAPYHVGMYVGEGTVIAAPHSGAVVRFEPLAAGGWDGFARILPDAGAALPPGPVERAARRHQVPANVLEAALDLGAGSDPDRMAAAIASAQARHPGDLEGALADAVGDARWRRSSSGAQPGRRWARGSGDRSGYYLSRPLPRLLRRRPPSCRRRAQPPPGSRAGSAPPAPPGPPSTRATGCSSGCRRAGRAGARWAGSPPSVT
jgi:cell wall-associated NlpC family hydrolase